MEGPEASSPRGLLWSGATPSPTRTRAWGASSPPGHTEGTQFTGAAVSAAYGTRQTGPWPEPAAGPGTRLAGMPSSILRPTLRSLAALLLLSASACSAPDSPPATVDFDHAVALCRGGDPTGALAALRTVLDSDPGAPQRALLEATFHDGLRDRPQFREALHEAAVRHEVSTLQLVSREEPGEWMEITGRVVDSEGDPVPGAVVRVFATDAQGRYHPEIEGERTSRIFGTLVSDERGEVHFSTVRPGPYPGTRNARHIHMSVSAGQRRLAYPHYAVFDDDPLLEEPQNSEQRGEALRIRMRAVEGSLTGELMLPLR